MAEHWQPGLVRLFASHLAAHKSEVTAVAEALLPYGFSTFVAHEAIDVSVQWREEIHRALDQCDCMLVFAHPGFHNSPWTDQEVGWALGRDVPIVVLWYPDADLRGFLEQYQAIPVRPGNDAPTALAAKVVDVFASRTELRGQVIDGLIAALGTAGSYIEAGKTAEMLDTLGDELRRSDIVAILHCFRSNDQVGGAILANRPLRRLVERRAPDLVGEFWPADEEEEV
jgi:hypothetical protein